MGDALETQLETLGDRGVVRVISRRGPSADAIIQLADEESADFLVLGADGMTAFVEGKSFLGSVSDAISRKALCNVLVCKEPADGN